MLPANATEPSRTFPPIAPCGNQQPFSVRCRTDTDCTPELRLGDRFVEFCSAGARSTLATYESEEESDRASSRLGIVGSEARPKRDSGANSAERVRAHPTGSRGGLARSRLQTVRCWRDH